MRLSSACALLIVTLIPQIAVALPASDVKSVNAAALPWFIRYDPRDPAYLSIADGYVVIRARVSSEIGASQVYLIVNDTQIPMKKQFSLINWGVYYGTTPYRGLPFSYYFKLVLNNATVINVFERDGEPFYFDGANRFPQVEWVKRGVGYQIFPERFCNGDPENDLLANETDMWTIYRKYGGVGGETPVFSEWDGQITRLHCCHQYFGGDIRGIIEKLDYLHELGVRLIYLNPIFKSGSAHGYDPYDYYAVDPKFGTLEDLKELLEEARKRDIRVIFDFVPDHVGIGFWAFLDVYEKGRASEYWDWFTIYKWPFKLLEDGAYDGWWGLESLPRLRTDNPEVKEYLFKVALYWLEVGFDGFRVDTPLDVRDNRRFFAELRELVKSKYPDAYIVGEIWHYDPSWVRGDAFDSLMNYALGMGILLEYGQGKLQGSGRDHVSYRLAQYFADYGVNVAGMGFNNINTHDTSRLLTMLGGGGRGSTPSREAIDRLKLVSTLQYFMPGAPVIFQGDERGIGGSREFYDEQRYPIQWNELNEEVYSHYKKLGSLKTTLRALHTSIISVLETSGSLLAFTRGYDDELLVVANNDRTSVSYRLPSGEWEVLYSTKEGVQVSGGVLVVPPIAAVVLQKRQEQAPPATTPPSPPQTPTSPAPPSTTPPSPPQTPTSPPSTVPVSEPPINFTTPPATNVSARAREDERVALWIVALVASIGVAAAAIYAARRAMGGRR